MLNEGSTAGGNIGHVTALQMVKKKIAPGRVLPSRQFKTESTDHCPRWHLTTLHVVLVMLFPIQTKAGLTLIILTSW